MPDVLELKALVVVALDVSETERVDVGDALLRDVRRRCSGRRWRWRIRLLRAAGDQERRRDERKYESNHDADSMQGRQERRRRLRAGRNEADTRVHGTAA